MEISAIIVEDNPTSSTMIRLGIEEFNRRLSGFTIYVVSEVRSMEGAEALILNQSNQEIRLVFLDMDLTGEKTGVDMVKAFPNLAYIVISRDKNASKRITNSASGKEVYYFIDKISEGVFELEDIVAAIEKFIKEKGSDFYRKILKIGSDKIILKETAFISKAPLQVRDEDGVKRILLCNDCDWKKDDHFFYSNIIDSNSTPSGCLFTIHKGTAKKNSSLTNIIQAENIDPKKFVRISGSVIVNLDYKHYLHQSSHLVYMRLKSTSGDVIAALDYSPSFMTEDILNTVSGK